MNKQELIESINHLPSDCSRPRPMIDKLTTLELIKLLDETQEVEIPMFVADFITEQKKLSHTLSYSIDACMSDGVAEWYWDNSELFVRAWLDGYTVEKEKRYRVKLKCIHPESEYLYYGMGSCKWRFRGKNESGYFRKNHTRKELEQAGFGWVFDCEGIEIKEVDG
ncbi:DUF1642 domain-containing protein [Streptococcus parasanguinis]|uniref:DUF1642 domain-containing protein n=1 Tax=Streptococcus parasanguinis TaxID=1318 RepID=UPI0039C016B7